MIRALRSPRPLASLLPSALAGFVLVAPLVAQDRDPIAAPIPEDEMAWLMERYEELSTPGEAHERLEAFVGDWSTTTRVWLAGPDAPPAESEGSSEIEWVLGGRFLQERSEGEIEGQDVEGIGLVGFDNSQGEYESVWIDSGNTGMYRSSGAWNEERDALVLSGERRDPLSGDISRFDYVRRVTGDDSFVFEIHDLGLGARVVEITYERD